VSDRVTIYEMPARRPANRGAADLDRCHLRRAHAETHGIPGGPRRPRFGGGDLRLGFREFQPAQHQLLDRRVPRAIRAGGRIIPVDRAPLRGYVSCVTDCPFEGSVAPEAVSRTATRLFALGCREVSLGDTVGHGTPETVAAMLRPVLATTSDDRIAAHFHNTAAGRSKTFRWRWNREFARSTPGTAGLAAAPYGFGSEGNIATEQVIERWSNGVSRPGIDRAGMIEATAFARSLRTAA